MLLCLIPTHNDVGPSRHHETTPHIRTPTSVRQAQGGDELSIDNIYNVVFVSKYEQDGKVSHLFIVVTRLGEDDIGLIDMTRDMFFQITTDIPQSWALLVSPLQRRPRCELVAMVRKEALTDKHPRNFHDRLVVTAWQLERPVRVIQRAVRRGLSVPMYMMCRRRLQREWYDFRILCNTN